MRPKLPLLVLLIGLLVLAPAPASAAGTVTVSIGTPLSVTNRLLIPVPVAVVCSPGVAPIVLSQVFVTVEQASGQSISHGTGVLTSLFGSSFLTCDGTTSNQVTVQVLPDSGSGPFHGGPAVVTASASLVFGTSCGVPGCFFIIDSESGTTGPTAQTLRG